MDQNGRSSVRKRPVGPDILILSTDPRTETGWPGPGPAKFRKLGLDRILKRFVYSWAVVPIYIKITQVFILNCLLKY